MIHAPSFQPLQAPRLFGRSGAPERARHALAGMLLALLTLTRPCAAEEVRIGGTGAALGAMNLVAEAFQRQKPGLSIRVLPSMGSGGGLKALGAGAIHLAVSSRPLTDAELRAGLVATEYGQTAMVFAVAGTSRTESLSLNELAEVYAGKVSQWPDGTKVRLVLRPVGEADNEVIKNLSPALREAKTSAEQRKGMLFALTDQEAASAIEKIPGAIGPSSLSLILSEKRLLKALAIDGVKPDTASIASGRYPMIKKMLIVSGPASSILAREFIQFLNSKEGRTILQQTGHWVK